MSRPATQPTANVWLSLRHRDRRDGVNPVEHTADR